MTWMKNIKGFLVDITGVLYNSSPGAPGIVIPGSIEAIAKILSSSQVRFVSNESTTTAEKLCFKLNGLGYCLDGDLIFLPAPVAARYVEQNGLNPYLLVHKDLHQVFQRCIRNGEPADCVVIGDAEDDFTFANMNNAFRTLLESPNPLIISLGSGLFYQTVHGPSLDLGAYVLALKHAVGSVKDCRHIVIGKPEEEYFQAAIDSMGLKKDEVVMIGDDIVNDIGGAQKIGLKAVLVRTGKWRPEWENHPSIKPDLIVDNLFSAVETILEGK